MITKLRLKNWKSHLDSEFDFSSGVNALVGIMGSGKSSAMDAICFAMFGTFPNLNSKKLNLDDLIMKRPLEKREAEVMLEFALDNSRFSVKRLISLGKGTTHAEIRKDGKLLDVDAENVTRLVEGALQMDYSLFSRAVYSEQNNIDYFLTIPKGRRVEQMDRMLQLDRFEQARELATSLKNSLSEAGKEKARLLGEMEKEGLDEKIRDSSSELKAIKEKLGALGSEAEKLREGRAELAGKLAEMEENEKLLASLDRKIEGLKSSLKEISSGLKSLGSADLDPEINKAEEELLGLKKQSGEKKAEADKERDEIASANTKIKIISEELENLESLGSKCPVCESEITEEKRGSLVNPRKKEEARLRELVKSLVSKLGQARKELEALDARILELSSRLSELKNMGELVEKKDQYSKELAGMEAKKAAIGPQDTASLRKTFQDFLVREKEAATKLLGLEEIKAKNEEILKDLLSRMELIHKTEAEVEKTSRQASDLDRLIRAVKLTQDQLRDEFLKTVNKIMNRVWEDLYPYEDFPGIRLSVNGDYILHLKSGNTWIPVDGIASGGERSLACLALRIAFSMAFVPNLRWLILDEPTHNLDSRSVLNFSGALNTMTKFVRQIFLITHEERIADNLEGSVYKLDRDKRKNEATKIANI